MLFLPLIFSNGYIHDLHLKLILKGNIYHWIKIQRYPHQQIRRNTFLCLSPFRFELRKECMVIALALYFCDPLSDALKVPSHLKETNRFSIVASSVVSLNWRSHRWRWGTRFMTTFHSVMHNAVHLQHLCLRIAAQIYIKWTTSPQKSSFIDENELPGFCIRENPPDTSFGLTSIHSSLV